MLGFVSIDHSCHLVHDHPVQTLHDSLRVYLLVFTLRPCIGTSNGASAQPAPGSEDL